MFNKAICPTVPFLSDDVVYVNVNVFSVAVHHTEAPLSVIIYGLKPIALAANDVLVTPTTSVHVNVITPDSHALIYFLLGSHHIHTGAVVSTHPVPLSVYPVAQIHLAYKLAGAVLHVCILFHPFDASYHPPNTE